MCGVAGAFTAEPGRAAAAVRMMVATQVHRGPDDEGLEVRPTTAGELAFGFRRLAIQDLSTAGHQPMVHPVTGDLLVFNGEVYNFKDLRARFQADGVAFRGHSDTEVVLHALARWGVAGLRQLHGMFAIAFYSARRQTLLLARDPLGIKPLYVGRSRIGLAFASEIRALCASSVVEAELDPRGLASFLAFGAVQGPLTMLRDVHLLDPGTYLEVDLSLSDVPSQAHAPRRFWAPPVPERPAPPAEEVREATANLLRTAMRTHLTSDVPVGLFLSSGVDSTALAHLAREVSSGDVEGFSVSIRGSGVFDEAPVAQRTARALGIGFHGVEVPEDEAVALARAWAGSTDQPTIDGLNTYVVAGAVRRRGIIVALSGLGGDEMFGGYSTFREVPRILRYLRVARLLPADYRGRIAELASRERSATQQQKARDFATHTRPTLRSLYLRRRRLFGDEELAAFGLTKALQQLDEDCVPQESEPDLWTLPEAFPLATLRILESRFYMANMLLRDADVFGMAHGLEIRVPLLDQGLVDYVLGLPDEAWSDRRAPGKPLLVRSVGRLPAEVIGLKKRGFSLPQARWLGGPLAASFSEWAAELESAGLVGEPAIQSVWQRFHDDPEGPSWSRPWALGVLGAWLRALRSRGATARLHEARPG